MEKTRTCHEADAHVDLIAAVTAEQMREWTRVMIDLIYRRLGLRVGPIFAEAVIVRVPTD